MQSANRGFDPRVRLATVARRLSIFASSKTNQDKIFYEMQSENRGFDPRVRLATVARRLSIFASSKTNQDKIFLRNAKCEQRASSLRVKQIKTKYFTKCKVRTEGLIPVSGLSNQ